MASGKSHMLRSYPLNTQKNNQLTEDIDQQLKLVEISLAQVSCQSILSSRGLFTRSTHTHTHTHTHIHTHTHRHTHTHTHTHRQTHTHTHTQSHTHRHTHTHTQTH